MARNPGTQRASPLRPLLALLTLAGLAAAFAGPGLAAADGAALELQRLVALGGSADRDVPRGGPGPLGAAHVAPHLAAFFDAFDADRDGRLQRGEAFAFFAWVEDQVAYRYDDEAEVAPRPGALVGDGRPGREHEQRPRETFAERAGDCEDFAALEVAFFRHWGAVAFVGEVNLRNPHQADHGIALVRWGTAPADAQGLLGPLGHYVLGRGNAFGAPAGVYVAVDHAGADAFGQLAPEAAPGALQLFDLRDPR